MSIDNRLASVADEMLPDVSEVYPNERQLLARRTLAAVTDKPHDAVPIVDECKAVGLDVVYSPAQGWRRGCLIACRRVRRHRHDRECCNGEMFHDFQPVLIPMIVELLN